MPPRHTMTPTSLPFTTLDVFTTTPFQGNPVAIVHLPKSVTISQRQRQLIAREFNLSETVFIHPPPPPAAQTSGEHPSKEAKGKKEPSEDGTTLTISIHTSIAEINFAGHPTVGTANYVLRKLDRGKLADEAGVAKIEVVALQARAGRIPIKLVELESADGSDVEKTVVEGVEIQVAHDVHIHDAPFRDTAFGHFPVVSIVKGMTFILAQVQSLEELAVPRASLLGSERTYTVQDQLDEGWREGLVTTYFWLDLGVDSRGKRQLRTRMLGSREDPATGSAASALCSWLTLGEKGQEARVEREYVVTQGVEMGRKSVIDVRVEVEGGEVKKVLLRGTARKVIEGWVDIPGEEDEAGAR